ncbi:LysR family transcriptional regulator [Bosea caraganae]|uniref:LysR family transcriptional regulator n=1 Tax=Bosea caraganae TaxID=2763117 RepID=A0A370L9S4_9HYPH|nr:LysR family transcriptional regulator [Bosea caraganae]RDJ21911.1 LysR family transcriptional regulator [Bosea caraganae]RDJ28057.1 LysR family transcriptional regulator [Bosea caraganae]
MEGSLRNLARRIDLTSLLLFEAVCELGSIGKAAERENIAPSALSKRLIDLEAAVQTPLLFRHTRGVDLTQAGESLLHHARSIFQILDKAQNELGEYVGGVKGHVRVHASIAAIVQFLPADLRSFIGGNDQIKIDLAEHLSADIMRAIRDGTADLGICSVPTPSSDLQIRQYRKDRLVLVVPSRHVLAGERSVPFEATLPFEHVALHANSAISIVTQRAAQRSSGTITLRVRVTGLDAMCRMIQIGLGIGVMPQRAFELIHGAGELVSVPLTDPWADRRIDIVARDFSTLPVAAKLLVDHLSSSAEKAD